MGNTGISKGTGNKGKNPSHLHISFPTKKLPSNLPHRGQAPSYSYVSPRSFPTAENLGRGKPRQKLLNFIKSN